ncbi:hypothetical protein AB1L30_01870 [Bremerella sp. JC817]|uniref:hypothetical protein n=1 Tax=Bremerella sp. JC817 TaxID=3231756 RepID=UPI003458FA68
MVKDTRESQSEFVKKSIAQSIVVAIAVVGVLYLLKAYFLAIKGISFLEIAENLNEVGDSFGVVNAMVSSIAILFIVQSLQEQVTANRISKEEAETNRIDAEIAKLQAEKEHQDLLLNRESTSRMVRLQEFSMRMQWLSTVNRLSRELDEIMDCDSPVGDFNSLESEKLFSWYRRGLAICAERLIANRFMESDGKVVQIVGEESKFAEDCLFVGNHVLDEWVEVHRRRSDPALHEPMENLGTVISERISDLDQKWSSVVRVQNGLQTISRLSKSCEEVERNEERESEICRGLFRAIFQVCSIQTRRLTEAVVFLS